MLSDLDIDALRHRKELREIIAEYDLADRANDLNGVITALQNLERLVER